MRIERRTLVAALAALLIGLVVAACDDDSGLDDLGVPDGAPDSAALDSAALDSATPDSAALDSATPDSAAVDSATPDSAAPDSATPDSAAPDSATSCTPEGQAYAVVPGAPPCCPGLQSVGCAAPDSSGTCQPCAGASYCTTCGDGVCGPGENECRCPADCP